MAAAALDTKEGTLLAVGGAWGAGRGSAARAKPSESLQTPGMETGKCTFGRGSENLDNAGFWLPWACCTALSGKAAAGSVLGHPRQPCTPLSDGMGSCGLSQIEAEPLPCEPPSLSLPFLPLTTNQEQWPGTGPTGSLVLARSARCSRHTPHPLGTAEPEEERGIWREDPFSPVPLETVYLHLVLDGEWETKNPRL